MKAKITRFIVALITIMGANTAMSLTNTDVNVRLISGYMWMDNSCTAAGPQGKVVSFRIRNTKGSNLYGVSITLGSVGFTAVSPVTYNSGTPSFTNRTSATVYIGDIATGDSVTAFFYVGYNCLIYPNNTNLTTDVVSFPVTLSDNLSGTVSQTFTTNVYVLRNSNNNTITIIATSLNTIGTLATLSVAYNISNVKPGNIIDMEISTLPTFPAGYEIVGCRFTASTITGDFPVGMINTHYSNSIVSNLPSGGSVTIEWTLKITGTYTGLTSSNLVPFVVSDAGSAQRWQANTTAFTGTSTPVNPLSISKRVNNAHVLTGDTVEYTIVISNSSTVADVTLDKILDNLPRDYQFRYMETNTGIFPRLVTYSNTTSYPEFNDTNYLLFMGHKQMGGGVFSWVIPRQDSIKLIYSTTVSNTPGLRDTNFVSMYVGNYNAGTAFSRVNVYAFLPVKVLYFEGEQSGNQVDLKWAFETTLNCSHFEISRLDPASGEYQLIKQLPGCNGDFEYRSDDVLGDGLSNTELSYRLRVFMPEGSYTDVYTDVALKQDADRYRIITANSNVIELKSSNASVRSLIMSVFDINGRLILNETVQSDNGIFSMPALNRLGSNQLLIIQVQAKGDSWYQKYISQ